METTDQEVMATFKKLAGSLPPFTITITDPDEGALLISALIYAVGDGMAGANALGEELRFACKTLGFEVGVNTWFDAVNASKRTKLPKFIKPVILHYFNHMKSENDKAKAQ